MAPIIHRLQPRLGRGLSVILVYLSLFGIVAVFMIVFLPALVQGLLAPAGHRAAGDRVRRPARSCRA
jgi:predicted PurR-regulated permease PerM